MKKYFLNTLYFNDFSQNNLNKISSLRYFLGKPLWTTPEYAVFKNSINKSNSIQQNRINLDKLKQANLKWIKQFDLVQLQLITFILENYQFKPTNVITVTDTNQHRYFSADRFDQIYFCKDVAERTQNNIYSIKFASLNNSLEEFVIFTDGTIQANNIKQNKLINIFNSIIDRVIQLKPVSKNKGCEVTQ